MKCQRTTIGFLLAALAVVGAGCGVTHIGQYKPKRREYTLEGQAGKEDEPQSAGSLWHPGRPASMLFTDARALRVNDLVVVKIEEVADAKRSANTDLTRESDSSAQITAFLGLLSKLKGIDPSIGGASTGHLKADGQSGRSEYLTATVPAVVRKVLSNGNLFVEGHRVVLVNAEEQHFYISGVVRPIDIDQENSVKSSMVADAEIEFVGSGVLTDNQHQGWFQRYFGWLWPF
ncbi:MAG TPA: flagellar basal body L-ring protein FlgH [Polyangia bacterium]|jgi:flagellar L-ring protein precursor FlgH|nr:flagellar basal body L-ring protein FlgH [Polyangia bacterium]